MPFIISVLRLLVVVFETQAQHFTSINLKFPVRYPCERATVFASSRAYNSAVSGYQRQIEWCEGTMRLIHLNHQVTKCSLIKFGRRLFPFHFFRSVFVLAIFMLPFYPRTIFSYGKRPINWMAISIDIWHFVKNLFLQNINRPNCVRLWHFLSLKRWPAVYLIYFWYIFFSHILLSQHNIFNCLGLVLDCWFCSNVYTDKEKPFSLH